MVVGYHHFRKHPCRPKNNLLNTKEKGGVLRDVDVDLHPLLRLGNINLFDLFDHRFLEWLYEVRTY